MIGQPQGPAPGARILRWAARLVPRSRRDAWRREWEAEIAYTWTRMNQQGPPTRFAIWRLRMRVTTSWIDALSERGETMKTTGLWNDARFALRGLIRAPGFTLVALATLAMGIGANTAMFSVVHATLFRAPPVQDPDELIWILDGKRLQ